MHLQRCYLQSRLVTGRGGIGLPNGQGMPVVDHEVSEMVWSQFGASVTMLRRAIELCPTPLWERPSDAMGYWYLAYHTLFFVDHDLHDADASFESPWFDRFEYELKELPPPYEKAYSKEDLLAYLDQCLTKARQVLSSLGRGESPDLRGGRRVGLRPLEVMLYTLRHVQHHTAQMNALLRSEGVEPPRWVRQFDGRGLEREAL